MNFNTLLSISPVDGRYRNITEKISEYFSEYAYIKYRLIVEIKWLEYILSCKEIIECNENINELEIIINNFNITECEHVKEIEKVTNHDVKAIEYYIKEKIGNTKLEKYSNFVHFANV